MFKKITSAEIGHNFAPASPLMGRVFKIHIFFCTILRLFYHHILQQYARAESPKAPSPGQAKPRASEATPWVKGILVSDAL